MFDVKLQIFKKSGKLFNDLIQLIANYQSTFLTRATGSIFRTLSF